MLRRFARARALATVQIFENSSTIKASDKRGTNTYMTWSHEYVNALQSDGQCKRCSIKAGSCAIKKDPEASLQITG